MGDAFIVHSNGDRMNNRGREAKFSSPNGELMLSLTIAFTFFLPDRSRGVSTATTTKLRRARRVDTPTIEVVKYRTRGLKERWTRGVEERGTRSGEKCK